MGSTEETTMNTTTQRIGAVVTWQTMQDDIEQFRDSGNPTVIIIDRTNPDHWNRYVDHVGRAYPDDVTEEDVPYGAFGYQYGYYPIDIGDGQIVPIGPLCRDCVRVDRDNMQAGDAPIAYHAEIQDAADEDSDGIYDRCCSECGEVLYSANE
jgi:hypothetical protein